MHCNLSPCPSNLIASNQPLLIRQPLASNQPLRPVGCLLNCSQIQPQTPPLPGNSDPSFEQKQFSNWSIYNQSCPNSVHSFFYRQNFLNIFLLILPANISEAPIMCQSVRYRVYTGKQKRHGPCPCGIHTNQILSPPGVICVVGRVKASNMFIF